MGCERARVCMVEDGGWFAYRSPPRAEASVLPCDGSRFFREGEIVCDTGVRHRTKFQVIDWMAALVVSSRFGLAWIYAEALVPLEGAQRC